jgi:hypothetical protein
MPRTSPARPAPNLGGVGTAALLRAVHTANLPPPLRQVSVLLLVATHRAGKLVIIRDEADHLNTHFRIFQAPIGIARNGDRLATGTASFTPR